MSPHVIDVNKCGGAVVWSQGVVSELVRGIVILSELVSRRERTASLRWQSLGKRQLLYHRGRDGDDTNAVHLR